MGTGDAGSRVIPSVARDLDQAQRNYLGRGSFFSLRPRSLASLGMTTLPPSPFPRHGTIRAVVRLLMPNATRPEC